MSAHPIGAAPSTAAFVRAQMAKGVSAETLRRRLGIRPEFMIRLVPEAGAERPQATPRPEPRAPTPEPEAAVESSDPQPWTQMNAILKAVGEVWDISPDLLRGRDLSARCKRPRGAACLLARRLDPPLSYPIIAAAMDRRDHATVMSVARVAQRFYERDADWRRRFDLAAGRLARP